MAIKNQAMYLVFYAQDLLTGKGKTGDAANITLYLVQDGGSPATLTNSISEINSTTMKGIYKVLLTANEVNYSTIDIKGESTTSDVEIYPRYIETHIDNTTDISTILSNQTTIINRIGVPTDLDDQGATLAGNTTDIFEALADNTTDITTIITMLEGLRDNFIYIDENDGTSGTDTTINGRPSNPVDNITDALTISAALTLYNFFITANTHLTVPYNTYDKHTFTGHSLENTSLDFSASILRYCCFRNTHIYNMLICSYSNFHNCKIGESDFAECSLINCIICDNINLAEPATRPVNVFKDCAFEKYSSTGDPIIIDMNGFDCDLFIENFTGKIQIKNNTNNDSVVNISGNGSVYIDSTCTSHNLIFISGNVELKNSSTVDVTDTSRIDQQNIRDSMTLATTDTIMPGSIDKKIDDISTTLGTPTNLDDQGATIAGNITDVFEALSDGTVVIGEVTLEENAQNESIIDNGCWEGRSTIDGGTPALALEETKQAVANDFSSSKLTGITEIKQSDASTEAFSFLTEQDAGGDITTKIRQVAP